MSPRYLIEDDLAKALIGYLAEYPYKQVFLLIEGLRNLQPEQVPEPEPHRRWADEEAELAAEQAASNGAGDVPSEVPQP